MTTLLETLQKDQLTARKAKDAISASLLTVLYSEAVNVGKNQGNRLTTDDEVIAVIKKMVKSSEQNIEIYTKAKKQEALVLTQKELIILSKYLPKAPSMDEVKSRVDEIIKSNNWAKESATMGKVMKELKVQYGSTLDGAATSKLLKELLST
jgi:uncharacterized protein YqeY